MLKKGTKRPLTQTGPARPWATCSAATGYRRCWRRNCRPMIAPAVRIKLLSERLLAFRDSEGRYGLIDEFCAHRGVSLWFGRNENGGLRCPYHGWKYDHTGQCIEVPSEPKESGFCNKIKLKSYPLIKIGDMLWTYMGPPRKSRPIRNGNLRLCRLSRRSHRSAGRSATGCRRWKAASIPAMSPGFIAAV